MTATVSAVPFSLCCLLIGCTVPSKGKALEELLREPIVLVSNRLSTTSTLDSPEGGHSISNIATHPPAPSISAVGENSTKSVYSLKLSEQDQTESLIYLKKGIELEYTQ